MTELQGWIAIVGLLGGFLATVFTIGIGWGRVQSELHRLCDRITEGIDANRDAHKVLADHNGRQDKKLGDLAVKLANTSTTCRFHHPESADD